MKDLTDQQKQRQQQQQTQKPQQQSYQKPQQPQQPKGNIGGGQQGHNNPYGNSPTTSNPPYGGGNKQGQSTK